MDEEHCVIAVPIANLRDSYSPQINAVTTSFLYVLPLPAVFYPSGLAATSPLQGEGLTGPPAFARRSRRGSGVMETTVQRYEYF